MNIILLAIIAMTALGILAALVLYWASKRFHVEEDPRIEEVLELLPAANCGGCGYPGCAGFAAATVSADKLDGLYCPVGGDRVMNAVAEALGKAVVSTDAKVAVLRCEGSCTNRPRTTVYDGSPSCLIASNLYSGTTACSYGCLGLGDCVKVCAFDAMHINDTTGLVEIDETKCTACGKCVDSCPKHLLELRKRGPKSRRIYVACRNNDKGAVAGKACAVACIACKKCQKACAFDAITIENNRAYIDDQKCRLCRKCVAVCPNNTIVELNFPPKKHETEVL